MAVLKDGKTSKEFKYDLLKLMKGLNMGGKVRSILLSQLNAGDLSGTMDLIKVCSRFVPKEVEVTRDNSYHFILSRELETITHANTNGGNDLEIVEAVVDGDDDVLDAEKEGSVKE